MCSEANLSMAAKQVSVRFDTEQNAIEVSQRH